MNKLPEKERDEIMALFKLFGTNSGKITNKKKFKKLETTSHENISEFKMFQIRIACFTRPSYNFNLIYAFKKKDKKWPKKI